MYKTTLQPDVPALTGLRFWAALFILLNHLLLGFIARDTPYFSKMLGMSGMLGMDTFFVLSGFIIHYNYNVKISLNARKVYGFFVARFSRLYPLFICAFLLDFLLVNISTPRPSLGDIAKSVGFFFTLSQSWFYMLTSTGVTVDDFYPRASITWSISTEMLMYCSYPLLWWLFTKDRLPIIYKTLAVCTGVLLLSGGLSYLGSHLEQLDRIGIALFGPQAGMARSAQFSFAFWLWFVSPYVRVFEFIIGALMAHLFFSLRDKPVGCIEGYVAGLLSGLAVLYVLLTFIPQQFSIYSINQLYGLIGYGPVLAIIIFGCARYRNSILTKFLSLKLFVKLGECSYSIYLCHIFFYGAVMYLPGSRALHVLVAWTAIFVCSRFLYNPIERPWLKRLRSLLLAYGPKKIENTENKISIVKF